MRRVVVSGVGLVTPLGVGVELNWQRLLAGHSGVRRVEALSGLPSQLAATVPVGDAEGDFAADRCPLLGPGDATSTSTFIQYALSASHRRLPSSPSRPAWASPCSCRRMSRTARSTTPPA